MSDEKKNSEEIEEQPDGAEEEKDEKTESRDDPSIDINFRDLTEESNQLLDQELRNIKEGEVPEELSILPIGDTVIFPYTIIPLAFSDSNFVAAVDEAMAKNRILGTLTIKGEKETDLDPDDLYKTGTAVVIHKLLKVPTGGMRLIVQGLTKFQISEFIQTDPFFKAKINVVDESNIKVTSEIEALMRSNIDMVQKIISQTPYLPDELQQAVVNIDTPIKLCYLVSSVVRMSIENKMEILETDDVITKLKLVYQALQKELEILELGGKIQSQVKDSMDKKQREYYLREQLKAIREELGEGEDFDDETEELKSKLFDADLPEKLQDEANKELKRLERMPSSAPEANVIRTYLDWLINLPWNKETKDNLDLDHAQEVLDEDHYALEEIKERIIEHLAVLKLKKDMKAPILCFIGPPGVGKTSLGKSIARAMDREFVRMSLGGMRDEAEIRGHRRTYIGALPGRIIQSIKRAGSRNPVFMLDEIDKVGTDFRGDPSSALLEVLDPEQNNSFRDHYLDFPFDLSRAFFIATANTPHSIQPALLDRMEKIELSGYTQIEKQHIATRHLIPRQLAEYGLLPEQLIISKKTLAEIIANYTLEAGVRQLEREIGKLCRKTARKLASGEKQMVSITPGQLHKYLGPKKIHPEVKQRTSRPGVATGLAWTAAGGDILFIEAIRMPGNKRLITTGHLGEVMQESVQAAYSYVRSRASWLGIDKSLIDNSDIHLHVPAGAIPKDGPSAGITMATAITSILTNKPVDHEVAMTGEITLSGQVLPIGGLKEKVLAAKRAGIRRIILPARNKQDVDQIPSYHTKDVKFIFVDTIDEVLENAFRQDDKS
jgi:ATP-dependent Lon protease